MKCARKQSSGADRQRAPEEGPWNRKDKTLTLEAGVRRLPFLLRVP